MTHNFAPKFFENAEAFRKWLDANAASTPQLLVGFYKVGSARPSMTWPESVDEALCYGWIDGVRNRIDDESYSIRFTPRKPTSIWSAINIAKFEQLLEKGRMQPAGVIAYSYRRDKKSKVYAYEQPQVAELSAVELQQFKKSEEAWQFFEATPTGYKKTVLHWVTSAKKLETRALRISSLIEACSSGKRLR